MAERELTFELPVQAGAVAEFAAAVGEDNQIYFDEDAARLSGMPGIVAPPTFSVRQIYAVPREEREERLGANLDYGRVLHGEQEFVYARLPAAGEVLTGTMRVARDVSKEGTRGGSMRIVTYETRFTDVQGDEVLTSSYTLIETSKDPSNSEETP